jgi:hypothetical protein
MEQSDIAIPILPSRSVNGTLTFFRRLKFEGKIHSHGDYTILTRGTVELHFCTHSEELARLHMLSVVGLMS